MMIAQDVLLYQWLGTILIIVINLLMIIIETNGSIMVHAVMITVTTTVMVAMTITVMIAVVVAMTITVMIAVVVTMTITVMITMVVAMTITVMVTHLVTKETPNIDNTQGNEDTTKHNRLGQEVEQWVELQVEADHLVINILI